MTNDTYRWQTTALAVLTDLIDAGHAAGLSQLTWTMADNGALTGEAHGLLRTPDQQRATIAAWAQHVGTQVTEHPRGNGRISLTAPLHHKGERVGILRAELFPELDDRPHRPPPRPASTTGAGLRRSVVIRC